MRAAVVTRYGPPEVVSVREVANPEPKADQVLIRVVATSVNSGDARIRAARFPPGFAVPARLAIGIRRPRRPILGTAVSGVIEAVGAEVSGFSVGDAVCAMPGFKMGSHAELTVVDAKRLSRVPEGVDHDRAAGILFGGGAARSYLHDKAPVADGMSVLVNGASGAVGIAAVQLAKLRGATVTGVCSGANAELVRSLGADRVIDRTTTDVTTLGERFDLVLDTVGNLSVASGRRLLSPGGTLALAVAGLGALVVPRREVVAGTATEHAADNDELLALVAAGDLQVVISEVLSLDDIVEAHRRVDSGRKVGNLLIHP